MKNSLQITLKDQATIQLEAMVKKTTDTFLKVHELLDGKSPLFLEIEHQQINTLLELSKVSPFVLLYFSDDLQFTGAAFSLNGSQSPFGVSTQAKKILLLHYPITFTLEEVAYLTLIS
jgi:hypothetical protein